MQINQTDNLKLQTKKSLKSLIVEQNHLETFLIKQHNLKNQIV